jgi:hypothetical protein
VIFGLAAFTLWLVFFVQAVNAPVLLDDWFQIRYWRDHEFTASAIWQYGRHNYFHYNPRIGDVLLAIVDGSRLFHLIATPLVQLGALITAFMIAFARLPRPTLRDTQLLLFMQVMIWLVIPIPGIIYFYRPIATNYLWAFTITLALFVPYRLALASTSARPQLWRVPIMLALGWLAGMSNEHTGPTAMVAMAAFVYAAWGRGQLRAWMISGAIGLYIGYPMLFFAPGQSVRYMGLAIRETPAKLLADRGVTGCLEILIQFISESRLGIAMFVAAVVRYVISFRRRGERTPSLPRETFTTAALLAAASGAIVVTLFMSPTTTDRVFYASGVLLVAAFASCAERLFAERSVRHLVVGACALVFAYHVVQFVAIYGEVKAENDERIARLETATPGTVAYLPPYEQTGRSRWHLGDDFQTYPWLAEYIASELYDLANVQVGGLGGQPLVRYRVARTFDPPLDPRLGARLPRIQGIPSYRQWQRDPLTRVRIAAQLTGYEGHRLVRFRVGALGLPFDDPKHRPILAVQWTRNGFEFVDGSPYEDSRGHFIRVRRASLPAHLQATSMIGCGQTYRVEPVLDGSDVLLPVDERTCRGIFTAIMCEPDRCWLAGWY